MKMLNVLIVTTILAGCSTTKSQEIPPEVFRTENTLGFLKEQGMFGAIITGYRPGDCEDDHYEIETGFIARTIENQVKSGTVCESNFEGHEPYIKYDDMKGLQ